MKAGKYDLAVKAYEDLGKKRPNSANVLWGLYKVYKKKGDLGKAKKYGTHLAEAIKFGDASLYPL